MRSVRLIAAALLIFVAAARMGGFSFGEWQPIPIGPVVDDDVTVWLVVVEEKSERPKGMAAFERSQFMQTLDAKRVEYFNVNDDEDSPEARAYVDSLGGRVPGYLLLNGDDGQVIDKGQIPDPVPSDFFEQLLRQEVGR